MSVVPTIEYMAKRKVKRASKATGYDKTIAGFSYFQLIVIFSVFLVFVLIFLL